MNPLFLSRPDIKIIRVNMRMMMSLLFACVFMFLALSLATWVIFETANFRQELPFDYHMAYNLPILCVILYFSMETMIYYRLPHARNLDNLEKREKLATLIREIMVKKGIDYPPKTTLIGHFVFSKNTPFFRFKRISHITFDDPGLDDIAISKSQSDSLILTLFPDSGSWELVYYVSAPFLVILDAMSGHEKMMLRKDGILNQINEN